MTATSASSSEKGYKATTNVTERTSLYQLSSRIIRGVDDWLHINARLSLREDMRYSLGEGVERVG